MQETVSRMYAPLEVLGKETALSAVALKYNNNNNINNNNNNNNNTFMLKETQQSPFIQPFIRLIDSLIYWFFLLFVRSLFHLINVT